MAEPCSPSPQSTLAPFQYTPLVDDESIRVLTLRPGSGSDPLVCSLATEPLASDPDYEAISYVWGTGGRHDSELICDGASLPLTQSIHDALSRMRHPSQPRRLWADQVCINQDDIAERSRQVKLMNSIYKNARRVLVWLGRDDLGVAADAVAMVHHLHRVFHDDDAHRAFRVDHSEGLARQSNEPWVPLSKLTRLPWFHRVWIVQEIGTSAPATVFWGDAEMEWDMLSSVAAVLSQSYHQLRLRFFIGTPSITYLHQRFVEPDARDKYQHDNRGSFVYELHRARHLSAKDPRDLVYAFLGHFSLRCGTEALAGLTADYSRSVEDVYTDVAVRNLLDCRSLILLSANNNRSAKNARLTSLLFQKPLPNLPSWVPDWRESPIHMLGTPVTPHAAAGNTSPALRIDEAERILHIKGVRIDTIKRYSWSFTGQPFQVHQHQHQRQHKTKSDQEKHHHDGPDDEDGTGTHSHSHSSHHTSIRLAAHQKSTYNASFESLWRNICRLPSPYDLSHPYTPTLSSSSPPFSSALFALLQTLTNACIGVDRSRPYPSIPHSELLSHGLAYLLRSGTYPHGAALSPSLRALANFSQGDPYAWVRQATLVTRGRRFAVTGGGYFVLGPDALQAGDVVVVLYGGRTPFLLRREKGGQGWTLVGECYVHGIMGGEALGLGAAEEEFSIL